MGFNFRYFKNIESFFKKDYLKAYHFTNEIYYSSDQRKNFLKFRLKQQIFKHDLPYALTIEDKISMSSSIETRVPFLNKFLVENIFKIDSKYFLENGLNKNILRNISRRLNHFQNWYGKKYQLPGDDYLFLKKHIDKFVIEKMQDDSDLDEIINKKNIIKKIKNLKKNEISKNFFIFRLLSYQRWKSQNV